ncbi:MAG: hypothetical protein KBG00_09325 [Rhodoferax sp.]|jgi:hypothetical protein|uniref:hypothetical protein n=1 Tax=Rhodoferax sp. TaxID=50421 RepID=UPI001B790914|nr:hypothetical protein [Rhodoferax sp.]MBP9148967.1 hypothetical protein [Rhodoferax sp.]MBP9735865.1 hypothetical protein [Rhodoferax sp.]
MILHPPVMALSLAALLSAGTLSWAGIFSVQLLRHWNLASGARRQIELERRTYLIATTLTLVLALQGFALLLMVFNADAMAPLLIGAMCAFGTFNASVFGFPALFAKMALFFAAIVWLAMNHADVQARDYPLTRRKYALLLLIAPLGLLDAALSLAYFADLKTDTLTSCCGTVFNPEKAGLGGEAAALDPRTALFLLAGSLGLTTVLGWLADRRPAMAVAYGAVSTVFFGVALAAVVSAVSIYIYENPHHHCPFCLLKREYNYIGFALYAPLFVGAACGLASGVLSLRPPPSLQTRLANLTRQLRRVSMVGFLVFGGLCAWAVVSSGLRI